MAIAIAHISLSTWLRLGCVPVALHIQMREVEFHSYSLSGSSSDSPGNFVLDEDRCGHVNLAEILAENKQESYPVIPFLVTEQRLGLAPKRQWPPFVNEAWTVYTCLPRPVNAYASGSQFAA